MADFKDAHEITAAYEGGYVNDPDDRGGETYKGVARKVWPNWEGWKIVDEWRPKAGDHDMNKVLATSDELQELIGKFYKTYFWDKLRLDSCADQDIAEELYDTAVNQGTRTASKYLQRCLNLINRDQRDWPDIKVDGKVGPNTLKILNTCISKGKRWITALLKSLNGEQYMRYRAISIFSSKQEKFFHGWLKRVSFKG